MSAKSSHLTPPQIFGQRVRETRLRRNWSQRELAERLHIDRTTLNKIERGSRGDVSISQLFEFAMVLEIAPVHLLTPRLDDKGVRVTEGSKPMKPRDARRWIRGEAMPAVTDPVGYILDLPSDEQRLVLEEMVSQDMPPLLRALVKEQTDERVDEIVRRLENEREESNDG